MKKEFIKQVLFIRRFEEKIIEIYHTDVIKSPVHLSIGQELFSVLLAENTTKGDKIVGNYRSHALSLSLTKTPQSISDELFATQKLLVEADEKLQDQAVSLYINGVVSPTTALFVELKELSKYWS